MASGLKNSKSRLVAIVVPTFHGSVFSEAIEAAAAALREHGFQMIIGESSYEVDQEEEAVAALLARRPDGIVIVGTRHTPRTRKMLESAGIPVVETWDIADHPLGANIGFSNFDAAEAMGLALIKKGYSRFGVISGPAVDGNRALQRLSGFRSALRKHGLQEKWCEIVPYHHVLGNLAEGGRHIVGLLQKRARIDCLFCTNELSGIGTIVALRRAGTKVPENIGVAGFGDVEIASLIEPALTTVRIRGREMGLRSSQLLLKHIEEDEDISGIVEDVGFEIAERDSA
ncbi:MAG: substrate-binding domain-containing protein [Hyphomonas sp.]|nr:substrate-binding domain-containing protein [Hyphomonas sp.]